MKISRVQIKNFRNFANLDVALGEHTVTAGEKVKLITAAQAVQRNELFAALADAVLVPYAVPGGRTDATARNALARGQPLFTFGDENNAHLIHAGAEVYELDRVRSTLGDGAIILRN